MNPQHERASTATVDRQTAAGRREQARQDPSEPTLSSPRAAQRSPAKTGDDPRILVVDDEKIARNVLGAQLESEGYSVTFATSGREAVEQLRKDSSFDLILSDVMMPGMNGFELCRAIKAHERWRFIPVILITALDNQDDLVRGLSEGADEFLTKPVQNIVLHARVRSMLRIRRQYSDLLLTVPDIESLLRMRLERIVSEANLSEREQQVLEQLLQGKNHKEIGVALGITVRTSKFHQSNILSKLGAESRNDLMRLFL